MRARRRSSVGISLLGTFGVRLMACETGVGTILDCSGRPVG